MAPAPRLASLDVFRGATIAGMVVVNNPGSWDHVYPPLRHAAWHGCTPTDLIFPFFLFIVGVAMAFSMAARAGDSDGAPGGIGRSEPRPYGKVLRRAGLLVAIGLILNAFPRFEPADVRWTGVLQRIGLAYALAAMLVMHAGRRGQLAAGAAVLVGHALCLRAMGLAPDDNPALHADRAIIPEAHLYAGSVTDPEGLLGTLPAAVTVLIGYRTGVWMRGRPMPGVPGRMAAAGAVMIAAGLAASLVVPLNKPLWTSSYVLFTGGWAIVCLASCVWTVDVHRGLGSRWLSLAAGPMRVLGVNALALFVGSGLLARVLPMLPAPDVSAANFKAWIAGGLMSALGPTPGSLAFALVNLAAWFLVLRVLWWRGVVIKL